MNVSKCSFHAVSKLGQEYYYINSLSPKETRLGLILLESGFRDLSSQLLTKLQCCNTNFKLEIKDEHRVRSAFYFIAQSYNEM